MNEFKFLNKKDVSKLPKNAGVYAFKKGAKLLYIGKAANIRERVRNHFLQPAYRDNLFLNQVEKIGYLKTNSEIEALILEAGLIKKYQPKYNIVWRDDKNYFFAGVTKEDFPRVFWTHQKDKFEIQNSKFKIEYVGPFVDGKALKQTLKVLRKVFPYRSCRIIPNRPCLWYHLNRCPAPCLLKSRFLKEIPFDSLKIKKICQRNAKNLMKILKEGKNSVLKDLKKEMKLAAKKQNFEEAARIRDQISALEKTFAHAKISEPIVQIPPWCKMYYRIEKALKNLLKTKGEISRIEAYDVSNIQGQEATGSMITFLNGLPDKNFYRRFKIKISGKPNDIAMLKEVLSRRFRHLEWGLPDLILIDGGIAQLKAGLEIKNRKPRPDQRSWLGSKIKKIKIMSLAKKENKLFIEGQKEPIPLNFLPNSLQSLILRLRDEAHRFARQYHLKLREIDFLPKS